MQINFFTGASAIVLAWWLERGIAKEYFVKLSCMVKIDVENSVSDYHRSFCFDWLIFSVDVNSLEYIFECLLSYFPKKCFDKFDYKFLWHLYSIKWARCSFVGYGVIPLHTIIFVVEFEKIESKTNSTSFQGIWLILEVLEILIDRNFKCWDNSCHE